jgi:hypothetical protein
MLRQFTGTPQTGGSRHRRLPVRGGLPRTGERGRIMLPEERQPDDPGQSNEASSWGQ